LTWNHHKEVASLPPADAAIIVPLTLCFTPQRHRDSFVASEIGGVTWRF